MASSMQAGNVADGLGFGSKQAGCPRPTSRHRSHPTHPPTQATDALLTRQQQAAQRSHHRRGVIGAGLKPQQRQVGGLWGRHRKGGMGWGQLRESHGPTY